MIAKAAIATTTTTTTQSQILDVRSILSALPADLRSMDLVSAPPRNVVIGQREAGHPEPAPPGSLVDAGRLPAGLAASAHRLPNATSADGRRNLPHPH